MAKHFCHLTKFKCETPWGDPTTWKKGFWYPIPMQNSFSDGEDFPDDWPTYWDLFMLDPEAPEWDEWAMTSVLKDAEFSMIRAIEICEKHNGEKLPRKRGKQ